MPQYSQNFDERFGPEKLPVGWPWRLFLFSLLIFASALIIYLGLVLGYRPYLNSQIAEKDAEIANLAASVPKEEQEGFLKFYSQLANLQSLLDKHVLGSKIFPFLERNTNQKVAYTNLDLRVPERQLTLEGRTQSYEILAQQLEAFNQSPEVVRLSIGESQLSEGQVRFRIFLTLSPAVFK